MISCSSDNLLQDSPSIFVAMLQMDKMVETALPEGLESME